MYMCEAQCCSGEEVDEDIRPSEENRSSTMHDVQQICKTTRIFWVAAPRAVVQADPETDDLPNGDNADSSVGVVCVVAVRSDSCEPTVSTAGWSLVSAKKIRSELSAFRSEIRSLCGLVG